MTNLLSWIIFVLALTKMSGSTLSDIDLHLVHNANATREHEPTWIGEASAPEHHPQYVRASSTPNAFVPSIEGLLAKYYYAAGNRHQTRANNHHQHNGFHFQPDTESLEKKLSAFNRHSMGEGGSSSIRHDYGPVVYRDHRPMPSVPEYDVAPLKKHDFVGGFGGGSNFGGWDAFPGGGGGGGGFGLGHGSGMAQVGQSVKGKDAKALFILMAPLILLAVFGPILATNAVIPWVANGGLSSVSTIAGGKRRKRSIYDPRQSAELEKRLRLFLEVQDFIAKSGSANFAEEMGEAFLRCQKFTERRNKCLERIACEYTDDTSGMDPAERRLAKMVFQNVMSNPLIPASIKGRLSKGSMFGKNHRSHCRNYWCEALDGSKVKS